MKLGVQKIESGNTSKHFCGKIPSLIDYEFSVRNKTQILHLSNIKVQNALTLPASLLLKIHLEQVQI